MSIPEKIRIYRMTHIDNLDYMIQTGIITCPNHPDADANYINIGDTTLISSRKSKEIQIAPGGTFQIMLPFILDQDLQCCTKFKRDLIM